MLTYYRTHAMAFMALACIVIALLTASVPAELSAVILALAAIVFAFIERALANA